MSRFMTLLETQRSRVLDLAAFSALGGEMLELLQADAGDITVDFPYFIAKTAPVSEVRSLLDYDVRWQVRATHHEGNAVQVGVTVPVTSLCPCSKSISDYGAHNQRSHITVTVVLDDVGQFDMAKLIKTIEQEASSELWSLLKRTDEKLVTERAYDNPKFVEDLVRDVAVQVAALPRVVSYTIEAENFESIHNHSAYAVITG